jgi:hypothetical protein
MFVDSGGSNGEAARFGVIRCTAGGGGNGGPVLSGCTRVGLGPAQTIGGNGLHSFTLAGSTQLDGAQADPTGIVVNAGDWICAQTQDYDIGVDCNGSPPPFGCPGPDFNTQRRDNLISIGQPFALTDPGSDGTMMIRAIGVEPDMPGVCSETAAEIDTTPCMVSGGDTCCGASCIVGPSGPGTCM